MSAAEDDTELRDLLIQNLENSGVLNKLKAEMRAAVFLAMEEQDKLENKTPLINENLKKCLNTKDGRLVASLIVDFLQVFNLDFSLAVFQPEINSLNGLDSRDLVCRELGLSESELNKNSPVLLELVRKGRHKDKTDVAAEGNKGGNIPKDLPQKQIAHARKKFDFYDKDRSGSVLTEDLMSVFTDLFPSLNKNMLERFITDELRAADKIFSKTIDFQFFLGMYKCFYNQCRSVVVQDSDVSQPQSQIPEEKIRSPSASKDSERSVSLGKGEFQQPAPNNRTSSSGLRRERLDLDLEGDGEDDPDDGDSFFDDPLPKPQKTYGCQSSLFGEKDSSEKTSSHKDLVPLREESFSGPVVSPMRRGKSLSDLSVLAGDSEVERDDPLSDHSHSAELRKVETSATGGSPAGSLSEAQRAGGRGGGGGGGGSSMSEQSHSRNAGVPGENPRMHRENMQTPCRKIPGKPEREPGTFLLQGASNSREKGFKAQSDKTGSLHLDDDVEYDDDFNSHRSDLSKSELSIGEEIEEVSIEGPDNSDKFDETTQDLSVSQLSQSHGADYMEEVA
ncbi:FGFR1 oncogene partner isoform X2 [Amphiprion ocellaris]|uniref:FGFR1 oncogene partner isoform X2 n=1 Tax=Amphiprion ocellaris TaxID=80972 RepID=UPI002410F3F6|nr:FGFR1 oncogene partner isoform X2 [Amphiprion ocellaris]